MNRKTRPLASAVIAILAAGAAPAMAQQSPNTLDTVIVTGTRVADRTVAESQSPIDIITPETLTATGTGELATALSRALPSLNFPRPALVDGTSGVRPAQLRGLSPDQVLVLVNGKRRHSSAMINVSGTIGRGSAPVDINAIPIAAIERVEVLRDGASAQYGSDAIAGVVNIVLKGSDSGGSLAIDHGQYSAGDGNRNQLSGDAGVSFGQGRGSLHVAGQISQQDESNRAGPYRGSTPNTGNFPAVGETTFVVGDPQVDTVAASANASFAFNDNVSAYANALVSNRDITSFAFYRSPNHSGQSALLAQIYPDGYVPQINQDARDRSVVAGVKGSTDGGWTWDVSVNHGENSLKFNTRNSINYALGVDSPRDFYDGALKYQQDIFNADFTRSLDWGLAYPVTLSFGGEYRREKWDQTAGELNSYTGSGAQGFAGFTPINEVHTDRDNYAVYAGLEADLTDRFSAGITGRYEDYSDFGDKVSGKLSARYAFTDQLALRATAASGFRAPALAQQGYQAVTSTIVNGEFVERGTFPAASAAAQALGSAPLKAESSTSYSVGLVLQPVDRLYLTVDAYQIDIDDRIALSSNVTVSGNPAVASLLSGLGLPQVTAFSYFTNGLDTRTRGVDAVASYTVPFTASSLELTAAYSYNDTEVKKVSGSPAVFAGLGITQSLIGRDELGRIEDSYPHDKSVLSGTWRSDHWEVGLAATRYGSFTVRNSATAARDQTYDAKWVLDASASYKPSANWTLTLGADNLLDEYPDRTADLQNSTWGMLPYSNYSPFGFNGAYVYGRIRYTW